MKLTLHNLRPSDLDREDLRPFVVVVLTCAVGIAVLAGIVTWPYVNWRVVLEVMS